MPLKSIYIRKGDESFWNWAEEEAAAKGQPLSLWISHLIRNHKYDTGAGSTREPTVADLIARSRANLEQVESMLETPS